MATDWDQFEAVPESPSKVEWSDFEPVRSRPEIKLDPYQQYRLKGGEPVAGPFGPASPEEVPALIDAAQRPFIPLPDTQAKGPLAAAYRSVIKPLIEGIESPMGVVMAPALTESVPLRVAAGVGFGGLAAKSGIEKMQSEDPQVQLEGRMELAGAPLLALSGGEREKIAPKLKESPQVKLGAPEAGIQSAEFKQPNLSSPVSADVSELRNQLENSGYKVLEHEGKKVITTPKMWEKAVKSGDWESGFIKESDMPSKVLDTLKAYQKAWDQFKTQAPPSGITGEAKPSEAPVSAAVEPSVAAEGTPQAMPDNGTVAPPEQAGSVTQPVTQPEIVGMGGAVPGEFIGSAGADIYGIAQRVREERAGAGQAAPIQPGQGVSDVEAVMHGRQLLAQDPLAAQKAADAFAQNKAIGYDAISVVRAKGEEASLAARRIEEKFGTDTPEYRNAFENLSRWDRISKDMQTEWHKSGQAQQGQTDIDTGSFTGLQRAFTEATGKTFDKSQKRVAEDLVAKSQKSTTSVNTAKEKLFKTLDVADVDPKVKTLADRIVSALDKGANDALSRIKARRAEGRLFTGIDPVELTDYAIYGAAKLAKGAVEFSRWSAEMVKDIGEYIEPHLKQIWEAANKHLDEQVLKGVPEPVKTAVRRVPVTLESVRAIVSEPKDGKLWTPKQVKSIWQYAKDSYLDKGVNDFTDLVHGVATDLGLKPQEVREALAQPKGAKRITDELYAKMSAQRRVQNTAKAWIRDQQVPGWLRFMRSVPRVFFIDKIFGHGTVGMITHAGLNIFDPVAWKTYWPNFIRQYGLVFKPSYHERLMQDLVRDPLYIKARRAGLANDPHRFSDDYQNAAIKTFMGKLGGLVGNRGFDSLKLFRQARFSQIWNGLPESLRTDDMAKMIADGVNHSTGVVAMPFREWTGWTFFAPKLEGSRWAWMIADPARAAKTFSKWKEATPEEKHFAMGELRQKATIAGTYFAMLAANQGLLSASGSKEKINYTNPRRGDFLAFKVAGHNVGLVSPLLGMVRLFANLYHDAVGKRGPLEKLTPRGSAIAEDLGAYGRGKLSPFAGQAYNLASQSDFQGRPLPFSSDPVPAYLRRRGIDRYTYGEYLTQELAPIPVEEALKEIWHNQGMNDSEIEKMLKALAVGIAAGGTGARVSQDYNTK